MLGSGSRVEIPLGSGSYKRSRSVVDLAKDPAARI
jgi:hypothetical protein